MPAVNPTRLSFQVADLMESFHSPEEFHKKIRDLFSRYANRTLRHGELSKMASLMPMYHLPDPVMRQLRSELNPIISREPGAALNLADSLWQDEVFEVRQVAVHILGHAGVTEPDPLISRLEKWLSPDLEPALKEAVLFSGTQRLQSKFPQHWETWIESLLARANPAWIGMGLMGLRAGLGTSTSQKLPIVFRIISPFIRDPKPGMLHEINRVIKALAEQSPTETAYFLKQTISLSDSPKTIHLVRQCLPFFSEEIRKELKEALKTE